MKKGILILLGMFMMVSTAEATIGEKSTSKIGVNYRYNDAITFYERGVQFHVFLNGDFDFNSHSSNSYYDYNGYRTKRGIRINRDFNGRVRSVGNVFINYDHRGNVKRIGNVFMRYNSGALTRVGSLKIKYNRWGDPYFYGRVKPNDRLYDGYGVNIGINLSDVCDYNDNYFYRPEFKRHYRQFKEDKNFFYYRAKPNANIGKRAKILKRRKVTSSYYRNKKVNKSKRSHKDRDDIYSRNLQKKEPAKRRTSRKSRQ